MSLSPSAVLMQYHNVIFTHSLKCIPPFQRHAMLINHSLPLGPPLLDSFPLPLTYPCALLRPLPLYNLLFKSNQKHRLSGPHSSLLPSVVRADPCLTPNPTANPFYYPRNVRCTIQLRHLLWHRYVLVHQGFVVRNHVFVAVGGGAFNGIGGAAKQVSPECVGDELQEWEDASRTRSGVGGG